MTMVDGIGQSGLDIREMSEPRAYGERMKTALVLPLSFLARHAFASGNHDRVREAVCGREVISKISRKRVHD